MVDRKQLRARIILPSRIFLDEEVDMVEVPGEEGVFGVLPDHIPLISSINTGVITIKISSLQKKYYIHGGIVQLDGHEVNVITDYAASITDSNKTNVKNKIIDLEKELLSYSKESEEYSIILDEISKHRSLMNFL